jgi:hypothetical protein
MKQYYVDMGKFINENTVPGDTISVLGNNCTVYLYTERDSASKYIYQLQPATVSPEIAAEYIADIKKRKPAMLIHSWYAPLPKFYAFVYTPVLELIRSDYYECFDSGRHIIYKRIVETK